MASNLSKELKVELFDQLLETTPSDIIWVFSSEWDELVFLDGAYEQLLGRPQDALADNPQDFLEAIHPDHREIVTDAMKRVSAGESVDVEYRVNPTKTTQRWLWSHGAPVLDESGAVVRIAGFTRDITDRKGREEQLKQQNKRLDEFASVVSHDLRNPLNVIEGRVELARQEYESEHLAAIDRAAGRMDELIKDLLALARQGGEVGEVEPVDIDSIASTCWQNVDTDSATLEVMAHRSIMANRSQIQQLLENVFRNAVEHAGPEVAVTVGEVKSGTGFYVADDGPGIAAEVREKVFAPGYSEGDVGTGFGLAIVHQIATAHGWEIVLVDSAAGGARFEFLEVPME